MNRSARTSDRFAKTRRQGAQGRPGPRSGGDGRRPAAPQGEFALPETITPALPRSRPSVSWTSPSSC